MEKKYYEIVVEGHYDYIYGMLEGFILGRKKKWHYYFGKKADIKTETLSEIISEWLTFKTKIHHLIIEEEFYNEFKSAMNEHSNHQTIHEKFIKSDKIIKSASVEFEFKAYGKKYADDIKATLNNLPEGLELHNYNPMEKVSPEGKGVERYAPEHEYAFEGSGTIKGNIGSVVEFRDKLIENPLIDVKHILLSF